MLDYLFTREAINKKIHDKKNIFCTSDMILPVISDPIRTKMSKKVLIGDPIPLLFKLYSRGLVITMSIYNASV